MDATQRPGGPYRQRLNDDPPPPPPGTRGWFVAAGAAVAVALAMSPRLAPATVEHRVDTRPFTLPYRVLHFRDTEVEPLRGIARFEPSSEGLVAVRSDGRAFLLRGDDHGERAVASLHAPDPAWASARGPTSVLGLVWHGTYFETHGCLQLDERTEECEPGRRTTVPADGVRWWSEDTCRIELGLARCPEGLASGRYLRRRRPAPIAGDVRFVALDAVEGTTCGVTADGGVRCWGPSLRTVEGLSDARSVTLRPDLGCALREGGAVSCWPMTERHVAAAVDALPPAVALAANATATCALDAAGAVRCWGAFGRAWPGHPRAHRARRPLDVALPGPVASLHPEQGGVMCARLHSSATRCWGGAPDAWSDDRPEGQLGDTAADETWEGTAVATERDTRRLDDGRVLVRDVAAPHGWSVLGDLPRARALAVGASHACALAEDGRAWCWGENNAGQLGLDDEVRDGARSVVMVERNAASGRGAATP